MPFYRTGVIANQAAAMLCSDTGTGKKDCISMAIIILLRLNKLNSQFIVTSTSSNFHEGGRSLFLIILLHCQT